MPAKPQQMSDSQEKSDDLIAELAKLMASNAQGSESEPKPTVIKLAPLGDPTAPPPVRIPGMAASATPPPLGAAAKPVTPVVRIPGLEKPAGIDAPGPSVAPPRPLPPRPVAAAPVIPAEPTSSPAPAPRPQAAPHVEPDMVPPSVVAPPVLVQPEAGAEADGFKFDFGFGAGDRAGTGDSGAPQPQEQPAPTSSVPHDPIADLIAAELDAAQAVPVAAAKPAPGAGVFPASVEVVPARTFGNTAAGQAPVLVARPIASTPRPAPGPAAFRPPQAAPRPTESDKFAVAPVFGLGSRSAPAAPLAPPPPALGASGPTAPAEPPRALDPMDEIENLIGEAVRVELSGSDEPTPGVQAHAQPQREPQPPVAPVVPPLTTGFAPRRAGLKDNGPQVRSAEAAILAAAAATGAEVGRISPAKGDDHPYKRSRAKAPGTADTFGGLRQYVGLAVAGTLLLAAGFGLYWVLGMGRGNTEAPVLAADATPAKQAPAPADAVAEEPARSVVFDEINGVAAVDDAETLVSRDETAGTDVAEVARVVTEEPATESGLANRKVRTVTVRPDGTIVSGDEAVAGTEALPVERPNVPVVPGASVEPSDLLTAAVGEADPAAGSEPDPIAAVIAEGQAVTTNAAPVEVAALVPTDRTPPVFDASLLAPVPMPRPVDRNALRSAVPAPTETAAAAPAATLDDLPLVDLDQPAAVSSGGAAAAYVQISSQPTEADAEAAIRSAQSRWGSLFNGNQLIVQRADLGAKGIKYRVRLPASSLQEATQICASIKADGGDCFATNG